MKAFPIFGRPKNTAETNVAFASLVVTVLAVMRIGRTPTSTLKFLFAKTMSTTSRLSRLAPMGFAFLAPANFIQSFFAMTAITMAVNFVRNAKIILLKLGTLSIATANAFTSAITA